MEGSAGGSGSALADMYNVCVMGPARHTAYVLSGRDKQLATSYKRGLCTTYRLSPTY